MGVGYTITVPEYESEPLVRVGGMIGRGTNNLAEYNALLIAAQHALRLGLWGPLMAYTDSQLMARQVNGEYKVKDARIKTVREELMHVLTLFSSARIEYLPRAANFEADALSHSLIFEEPSYSQRVGACKSKLTPWQIAAIQQWGRHRGCPPGVLARIFGVGRRIIDSALGHAARNRGNYTDLPPWSRSKLDPIPPFGAVEFVSSAGLEVL
jgi:ribonuclease HI/probable phosphoglycerate mutase